MATEELGSLQISMGANDSEFIRSISSIKRSMKVLDETFNASITTQGKFEDSLKRNQATSDHLSKKLQMQRDIVEGLKRKYEDSVRAKGIDAKESQNLNIQYQKSIAAMNRLQGRLNNVNEKIREQSSELGQLKDSAKRNIDKIGDSINLLNARFDVTTSGIRDFGRSTDDMRIKQQHLTRTLDLQEQQMNELKRVFEETRRVKGDDTRETNEAERAYLAAEGAMRRTENQLRDVNDEINEQGNSWNRLRDRMNDSASRMENIGGRMQSAGSNITQSFGIASAVIGGGLAVAGKKAMDFESQMSSVMSVMSPDEANKFGGALEDLAIKMGADTKYSAIEAAQGIEELTKAGVKTTDIINGGLDGALSLATAGELELADAAEIASTALNAFKDDNLTVMQAADLLAGAANASATSVSEMKFGLSQVSAVASGAGLSFADTTAALATFANNGLKGSDAGTSLKTMLSNLIPKSKEAWGMFEELGLMSFDAAKGMEFLADQGIKPVSLKMEDVQKAIENYIMKQEGVKKWNADCEKSFQGLGTASGFLNNAFYDTSGNIEDMSTIAGALQKSMKDLTAEQRQQALYTLFGSDAVRAGTILFKEGADGVEEMATAMGKVKSADVAAKKLDNVKGRMEQLKGSVETAAISLGNALLPTFDKVIGGVQKVTDWFNDLDPAMQNTIATTGLVALGITGIATAIGVGLSVFGSAITGLGALTGALGLTAGAAGAAGISIGAVMWPVTAAVAAIAGLTAAGVYLYKNWDNLTESSNRWKLALFALLPGVLPIVGAIKAFQWGMKDSIPTATEFGDEVSNSTQKAIGGFIKLRDDAVGTLSEMFISGETVTAEGAKNLIGKFDAMGNEIKNKMKGHLEEQLKDTQSFFQKSSVLTGDEEAKVIGKLEEDNTKKQESIQKHQDRIKEIMNKAKDEKRGITDAERAEINGIQAAMVQTGVNVLSKNEVESKAIMERLRQSAGTITAKQAAEVVVNSTKQKDEAVKKANEQYDGTIKTIIRMRDEMGIISKDQANDLIREAERQKNESIRKAEDMHKGVVKEAKEQAGEHVNKVSWTTGKVKSNWEVMRDDTAIKMAKISGNIIKTWRGLSVVIPKEATKAANGVIGGINSMIGAINSISKYVGLPHIKRIPRVGYENNDKSAKINTGRKNQYAYAKGTSINGHPEDSMAIISEKGRELVHDPKVGTYLSGDKGAELQFLHKGSSVLPNKETEKLLKGYGFPGYEKGIGNFFDWVSGGSKSVVNNTLKSLGMNGFKLPGGFKGIGDGIFSFLKSGMINFFKDKIQNFISPNISGGVAGNKQVEAWVRQALAITDTPLSWLPAMMVKAQKESGFNPRAINLWDSNYRAGHPSKGLFQTIDPTFNAYKMNGMNDIYNPIHNTVAAIRYIKSRYGNVWNTPGIKSMARGGGYKGYWTGIDNVPYDQLAMVGERGRELVGLPGGSKVFNNSETDKLLSGRNIDMRRLEGLLEGLSDQNHKDNQDMLTVMYKILEKGFQVFLDGKDIQSSVNGLNDRDSYMKSSFQGR
ncbi:phage tail tape measure protein [Bacillus gobiensis]|uniref:phage tail tape measure protein n=1 Tax=Bacillus gobiensis TaxID=1441095 RepID=UPI003D1AD61C